MVMLVCETVHKVLPQEQPGHLQFPLRSAQKSTCQQKSCMSISYALCTSQGLEQDCIVLQAWAAR